MKYITRCIKNNFYLCALIFGALCLVASCTTVLEQELAEEHYNLGNIYYELEEYDRAVEQYNKAISIDNTILRSNFNLALAHIGANRFEQALVTLQSLLDNDPENPLVMETIAFVHYQLGDSQVAIEWNEEVLQLIPNKTSALYNIGVIFHNQGDIVMALQYLETASRYENNNATHLYTLLLMYEELDQLLADADIDVDDLQDGEEVEINDISAEDNELPNTEQSVVQSDDVQSDDAPNVEPIAQPVDATTSEDTTDQPEPDGESGDTIDNTPSAVLNASEDELQQDIPLTEQLRNATSVDVSETHRLELARQLLYHSEITDIHRLYLGTFFTQLTYYNEALTAYQGIAQGSDTYGAAQYFTAEVELLHIDQPRSGLESLSTALEAGYRDQEQFIELVNHEPLLQREEILLIFNANDVDVAQ